MGFVFVSEDMRGMLRLPRGPPRLLRARGMYYTIMIGHSGEHLGHFGVCIG